MHTFFGILLPCTIAGVETCWNLLRRRHAWPDPRDAHTSEGGAGAAGSTPLLHAVLLFATLRQSRVGINVIHDVEEQGHAQRYCTVVVAVALLQASSSIVRVCERSEHAGACVPAIIIIPPHQIIIGSFARERCEVYPKKRVSWEYTTRIFFRGKDKGK